MEEFNPYQILGVTPDMNLKSVKAAYHRLALQHHPDRGGDSETYKKLKEAFILIVNYLKNGVPIPKEIASTHTELRETSRTQVPISQPTPQEFFETNQPINPNRNFKNETFNQKFLRMGAQNRDIPSDDYREKRTREQLLNEQQQVNGELSQIKSIFAGD